MNPRRTTTIRLSPGSVRALRGLARSHGYTQSRGAGAGELGSISQLMDAIACGEVATVLLPDEHFAPAIAALEVLDDSGFGWATSIADSLRTALDRQAETERQELAQYAPEE